MRLTRNRALVIAAMFGAALIALLPLRLVAGWAGLERSGLSARDASGSVWSGTLAEARFATVPLGDLEARLDPLALFVGRARLALRRPGDEGDAKGALLITRNESGVEDVTARLPLGSTFAPLPLIAFDLTEVSVRFRDGHCDRAEGRVRAEIDGGAIGLALPGGLSGNIRCDGGALLLRLASQSAMETVAIRLIAANRYRVEFRVLSDDPAARARLLGAGFAPREKGFAMSYEGSF